MARASLQIATVVGFLGIGWIAGKAQTSAPEFETVKLSATRERHRRLAGRPRIPLLSRAALVLVVMRQRQAATIDMAAHNANHELEGSLIKQSCLRPLNTGRAAHGALMREGGILPPLVHVAAPCKPSAGGWSAGGCGQFVADEVCHPVTRWPRASGHVSAAPFG
jgi:hypothetical protein